MKTVEVKTAELSGSALDWAVAKSVPQKYWPVIVRGLVYLDNECEHIPYSPSNDWSQCGPLIEKHKAFPARYDDECEDATEATRFFCSYGSLLDMNTYCEGPTPLIAACRAIVAAKLGETVSVPVELLEVAE